MATHQQFLFMAVFGDEKTAQSVAENFKVAAKEGNVKIDGLASVHRDSHSRIHIHEIGDITGSQGAVRGGAVGALVGLLFPPTILASTVIGSALAATFAKLHDKGFQTSDLHGLGESLQANESAVLFVGESGVEESLGNELMHSHRVEKQAAPENLAEHFAEFQGVL